MTKRKQQVDEPYKTKNRKLHDNKIDDQVKNIQKMYSERESKLLEKVDKWLEEEESTGAFNLYIPSFSPSPHMRFSIFVCFCLT